MKSSTSSPQAIAGLALGAVSMSVLAGLAFSGWIAHGGSIFMSLIESGMAWCF
jgi:hypothetical protein